MASKKTTKTPSKSIPKPVPRPKKVVHQKKVSCNSSNGAIYGLGFVGALVYYIATADGFWHGVVGVLKALVWPAMLVYHLLGM